jgi:DNA-binding NtrC family response regulator
VRELRNVVERAVLTCTDPVIDVQHLIGDARTIPAGAGRESGPGGPSSGPWAPAPASSAEGLRGEMELFERQRIADALDRCGGNQTSAAKMLGISRRTLIERLDAYQLPRPRKGKRAR